MTVAAEPSGLLPARPPSVEHVVLVDARGRPSGTVPKGQVHDRDTPLHLAFSCHLARADGAVLLTRRSAEKVTWPGWWTNGCCGHPQLGESLREAVVRRLREELGIEPLALEVALADFAYRAAMVDGTVEHELCPVLFALVDGDVDPEPDEVGDHRWVAWDDLVARARLEPETLSPWCVEQVTQLHEAGIVPLDRLRSPEAGGGLLDAAIELPDLADVVPGAPPVLRLVDPAAEWDGDDPFAPVRGPVADVLGRFLQAKAAELEDVDPALAAMADEVQALVDAGGKRLRPAFAYWGHRATGAADDGSVLPAAAAVELLHTFALIHDDLMDRSVTRRGRPSAYVSMAEAHRAGGCAGDSEWFGFSAAMLAGDLAFVWADELFEAGPSSVDAIARARDVFTELRREVIAGQYLDLTLAADPGAAEALARRVALLKSARYTVTRPLLLGAALADGGATPEVVAALGTYGDAVGLAFQMRDDVLGTFGDPAVTGKSRLDDLREGKRTVLVLRALRLAAPGGRDVLAAGLGRADL
ncbi:MAG TPA: isopentenyl-diphosphate Delta-isomerase, partial [Aquihabitans sp.]|nr:isopentenyl-diphosphate Delta-isomerase [Aquihabitans sp.]